METLIIMKYNAYLWKQGGRIDKRHLNLCNQGGGEGHWAVYYTSHQGSYSLASQL